MKEKQEYDYFQEKKEQSSRPYDVCPYLKQLNEDYLRVTTDTKVCLIGDGQGADTMAFRNYGAKTENISSVNYEQSEVVAANNKLKRMGLVMKQGDATDWDSLQAAGLEENSQDVVTLMHVLEVPFMRGDKLDNLVKNMHRILKPGGKLLVTQYKKKWKPEEAKKYGVEEVTADMVQDWFGKDDWREKFKNLYGQDWYEGMLFSEISNIRSKEELQDIFKNGFELAVWQYEALMPDNRSYLVKKLSAKKRPTKDEFVMILRKI